MWRIPQSVTTQICTTKLETRTCASSKNFTLRKDSYLAKSFCPLSSMTLMFRNMLIALGNRHYVIFTGNTPQSLGSQCVGAWFLLLLFSSAHCMTTLIQRVASNSRATVNVPIAETLLRNSLVAEKKRSVSDLEPLLVSLALGGSSSSATQLSACAGTVKKLIFEVAKSMVLDYLLVSWRYIWPKECSLFGTVENSYSRWRTESAPYRL